MATYASDGSYSDVHAKYLLTSGNADVITLPEGNFDWGTSKLVVTHPVTIKGISNRDATTINSSTVSSAITDVVIYCLPDSRGAEGAGNYRFENITFNGQSAGGIGGAILMNGAFGYVGPHLVVGRCRFKNYTDGTTAVRATGQVRGLVYSNEFVDGNNPFRIFGYNDPYNEWVDPVYLNTRAFGSVDNFYFEDNQIFWTFPFKYSPSPGVEYGLASAPGWMESGQSSRIVARYNTWDHANIVSADNFSATSLEFWDVHGFQSFNIVVGQTGSMVSEFYGNRVLNYPAGAAMKIRGGWNLAHNNIITTRDGALAKIFMQQYDHTSESGCMVDVEARLGYSLSARGELTNTYAFNNTVDGVIHPMIRAFIGPGCPNPRNIDWFTDNAAFDGTIGSPANADGDYPSGGVGKGTSNPSMSAEDGLGYWVCATTDPTVDVDTVQSGHLWKRVSGSWIDYYHPFTYPHPLQSTAPTTPPSTSSKRKAILARRRGLY